MVNATLPKDHMSNFLNLKLILEKKSWTLIGLACLVFFLFSSSNHGIVDSFIPVL